MSSSDRPLFTAIVLAADRAAADPVARAAGVSCKALAPVGGRPMLLRVLDALDQAEEVGACVVCGPAAEILEREPLLKGRVGAGALRWVPPQATPSTSALFALNSIPEHSPVLLTTADHALLTAEIVDHFCREARAKACDVAAALASHALTMAAFPGMRRTKTRFREGAFCGCNLFAFLTAEGRAAAGFWRRVEHQRKRPVKMLGELGWGVVLRYVLGRLSLAEALAYASRTMGLEVGAVILPFPEAAVDVDSEADWRFAETIAARAGAERAGSVKPAGDGPHRRPPPPEVGR
jgi:GTP:adenosylcobinamide-phosphate guanylyltransferase